MGADAETNKQHMATVVAPVSNGKVSDEVETKISNAMDAPSKPVGGGKVPNGGLTDDETGATLAAASEKLQAAHRGDQKKSKEGVAGCFSALFPKRFFTRFRDFYINTCVMAAEKGDFVDLVAGHHAYYGETVMSRNMSQRRDREHEEMLNASLSRQVSISLSRQVSQNQSQFGPLMMTRNTSNGIPGLSRNASTGIPGLTRNASTGIPGLTRQTSTPNGIAGLKQNPSNGVGGFNRFISGGRNTFGSSTSSKKHAESNLFSAGRDKFSKERAADFSRLEPGPDKVNQKRSPN